MASSIKDCCPSSVGPVITSGYNPKGSFSAIGGTKTYVTGSATATRGIIHVYDVFGYLPQIQQGADRLVAALNAVVLMPDFLDGYYAKKEWFSDTPGFAEAKQKFMAHISIGRHSESLVKYAGDAKQAYPNAVGWGALGMCWGGKVVAVTSGKDTPFKVTGSAHPASPTKEDAEAMTIPHICLAATSDNKDGGIDAYAEVFKQKGKIGYVETYSTVEHGWMAARANLEQENEAKEFERGYNQIVEFFSENF